MVTKMKYYLLAALLFISGCCTSVNDPNCTVAEKDELLEKSKTTLEAEQDGVKLYSVIRYGQRVYFTTPCGDTSWTTEEHSGKTSIFVPHQISGIGCK